MQGAPWGSLLVVPILGVGGISIAAGVALGAFARPSLEPNSVPPSLTASLIRTLEAGSERSGISWRVNAPPECDAVRVEIDGTTYAMPIYDMEGAGREILVTKWTDATRVKVGTITDPHETAMIRAAWVAGACRHITSGPEQALFSAMFCPLEREPVSKPCDLPQFEGDTP